MTDAGQASSLHDMARDEGSSGALTPAAEESAFGQLVVPCLDQLVAQLAPGPAVAVFVDPQGMVLASSTLKASEPRACTAWGVPTGWRHAAAALHVDGQMMGGLQAACANLCVDIAQLAQMVQFAAGLLSRQIEARARSRGDYFEVIGQVARFMAHALGNPLAGLSLTVELWASNPQGPGADRFIARSQRILARLTEFKENLGALGGGPTERQQIHTSTWLQQVLQAQHLDAVYRGDVVVESGAETLQAHPGLLATALGYLLRNMTDAMPDGGNFGIHVRALGHATRITVWDDGPGMAGRLLPELFRTAVSTRKHGGGMGLLLVAMIVESLHGGVVRYEYRVPHGSAFHLDLPRHAGGGAC